MSMRVVIIGNSAASLAAAQSFRRFDTRSDLWLVAREPGLAYSRVLLPYLLRGSLPRERVFVRQAADYEALGARTRFGCAVNRVDDRGHTVALEDGSLLPYDRLLVASGARPVLPRIKDLAGPGIHTLWTLADANRLEPELRPGRRVTLIGSGFVSLQTAWAAQVRGLRVTVLEALPRILPKVLDEKASTLLEERMREQGVDVRCAVGIERIERRAGAAADALLRVVLSCEEPSVDADLVVIGAGVRANLEFLEGTSVAVAPGGAGILVDEHLRSSVPDIYAAGDAALGPSVFGEPHVAQALWPTAVEQGKVAGANLAGHECVYTGSLNMNVAELFGLTVASLGQFLPTGAPGEETTEEHDRRTGRYVKLLFRCGIPVGGIMLGSPEDLAVLAALRPLVRAHRRGPLESSRPFAGLHRRLARPELAIQGKS
jgi:NADPH-dependent 2,4-dienoyl-CoA reductase/sulfur reductase-like enzyme